MLYEDDSEDGDLDEPERVTVVLVEKEDLDGSVCLLCNC